MNNEEVVETNPNPRDEVKPTLEDYLIAPDGEGPLAYEWSDKPHRLIYDLVERCRKLEARATPPTPVEDERLEEIRERRAEISPPPWESVPVIEGSEWRVINGPVQIIQDEMASRRAFTHIPDADFIANAPADIDYLLTRLSQAEAQSARVERLEAQMNGLLNTLAKSEQRCAELTAQVESVRRETAEHAAEIAGRYDDYRGDGNVVDEVARVILAEILGEAAAAEGSK